MAPPPVALRPVKSVVNHGRQIFIYNHIHTNQVVYSLTRTLNNTDALKQLPFMAKHTVPRALRKDHWTPLATVTFPDGEMGLKTLHLLREFRKLHETCYDRKLVEGKTRRERKYILMDQKANSIADLAVSLRLEIERAEKKMTPVAEGDIVVRWRNLHDAQYAAEWPRLVQHGDQGRADRPYQAPEIPGLEPGRKQRRLARAEKAIAREEERKRIEALPAAERAKALKAMKAALKEEIKQAAEQRAARLAAQQTQPQV